eukprot:12248581-Heterocapsa_arctica.AAC.1
MVTPLAGPLRVGAGASARSPASPRRRFVSARAPSSPRGRFVCAKASSAWPLGASERPTGGSGAGPA